MTEAERRLSEALEHLHLLADELEYRIENGGITPPQWVMRQVINLIYIIED